MSDRKEELSKRREDMLRERLLGMIHDTCKEILSSASGFSGKAPFEMIIKTVEDVIKYVYKEDIEFKVVEKNGDETTYEVVCLGEELMTFGIKVVKKDDYDFEGELEGLDLDHLPKELKNELKSMLDKLSSKLG